MERSEPSLVNDPTDEGRALGREVARLADAEFAKNPALRPRCHDCAFAAKMTATKATCAQKFWRSRT